MRVLLFGAGGYLKRYISEILSIPNITIIGIADNDGSLWGTEKYECLIGSIESFDSSDYDIILLTSWSAYHIERQLLGLGVKREIIKRLGELTGFYKKSEIVHYPNTKNNSSVGRVLVISRNLDFTGSSLAAYYLLISFGKKGYSCAVAAASGDDDFIDFLLKADIEVWIRPNIEFEEVADQGWITEYDLLIINTYQMHNCLVHIMHKNMMLWLHEPLGIIEGQINFWGRRDKEFYHKVKVYGSSKRASRNFNKAYPDIPVGQMECAIQSVAVSDRSVEKRADGKVVFAIVGSVYPLKGQDIFVDAVRMLNEDEREKSEFWIIGKILDNEYAETVIQNAEKIGNIRLLGEKTREEMDHIYEKIDVAVVASSEETLSLVAIEAMLRKKPCILSSETGITEYLTDKTAAAVFKVGDSADLSDKIRCLLQNKDFRDHVGNNGYEVYERYFSMQRLEDRVEMLLRDFRIS